MDMSVLRDLKVAVSFHVEVVAINNARADIAWIYRVPTGYPLLAATSWLKLLNPLALAHLGHIDVTLGVHS
jgi:hypothetical protein